MVKIAGEDDELLRQILSSFSCEWDEDIENFLHKRAIEFKKIKNFSDKENFNLIVVSLWNIVL